MRSEALRPPTKRLLTVAEAASYCGVSVPTFERICPISPISLDASGRNDRRLMRYDVVALDGWIDLLSGRMSGVPEAEDWASKVF